MEKLKLHLQLMKFLINKNNFTIMNPAENYILSKPEPFKSILIQLQILIETNYPKVDLKYKWNLPMYYLDDNPFCYLNAPIKKGYVDLCFWASAHLKNYLEYLVTENRKVVKSLRYTSVDEIDGEILLEILKEAANKNHKGFYKR